MMNNIFKKIREDYRVFVSRKGVIELTAGEHELFIYANYKHHEKVLFEVHDYEKQIACSYLPHNRFEIEDKEDGFLLKAKVESGRIKFSWFIK